MSEINLLLLLSAAMWSAGNVLITGNKTINEIRDRILIGVVDLKDLPLEHRTLILKNDWIPFTIAI
jgi:hypothetical protein